MSDDDLGTRLQKLIDGLMELSREELEDLCSEMSEDELGLVVLQLESFIAGTERPPEDGK